MKEEYVKRIARLKKKVGSVVLSLGMAAALIMTGALSDVNGINGALSRSDMNNTQNISSLIEANAASDNLTAISVTDNADGMKDYSGYTEIATAEDLIDINNDLSGKYVLKNDINMENIEWKPIDFSGVLDGNGYSILNLTVNSLGENTAVTYDGNMKTYDTYFSGMFGILTNATVTDLSLVNERVKVDADKPCFIGGIAGFTENSQISNCNVQATLDLTVQAKMFGVGGIVGYGSGSIDYTNADVTLICTDTNREEKDEQFMGGGYAAGYLNLDHCEIKIAGYDSDHGYVHNGGLVGMYILYPAGNTYEGYITHNNVNGKITFFEDNLDRRAYCVAFIGEIMNWTFSNGWNTENFSRDEKFDYSVDLKPDMCENPHYSTEVTESTCDTFGYTTYTCDTCGYSYTDNYTLHSHDVTDWKVTKEATATEEGMRAGACSICGKEITEKTPILVVTEIAADNQSEAGNNSDTQSSRAWIWIVAAVVILVAAAALGLFIYAKSVQAKRRRKRRRRR